jgi:hypothetical protein
MSEDANIPTELFPDLPGRELLTVDEDAKAGKYSGAIIERNRAKVEAICRALAEGIGVKRIASAFSVSIHTVLGLRDRHPELIATQKKEASNQLGRIAKLMAENIEERLIAGTMKPSSVDLGIVLDKKAMLDGDAGLVIEHRHSVAGGADAFLKRIEEMKKAAVIEVQTVVTDGVSVGEHAICAGFDGSAGFAVVGDVVEAPSVVHGVAAGGADLVAGERGQERAEVGGGDASGAGVDVVSMGSASGGEGQKRVLDGSTAGGSNL